MTNNIKKIKYNKVDQTIYSSHFRYQLKKLVKKNKPVAKKLFKIIIELESFDISTQYHNHILSDGKTYELHVEKDVLLLYRYTGRDLYIDLILIDLTNHKHLNNKLEDDLDINLTEDTSYKLNSLLKKYPDAYIPKYDKVSGLPILPKSEYGDWGYLNLAESLTEDIEKHDDLNPLLFENDELKPDVKEAIEKIAEQFIDGLKEDKIKFYLNDIVLVGSNVSYNYTKDSDLDIHLIANSDELKCPDDLYPLLYSAYRSIFNNNYDLTIKGIPAEIYVEMDKPTGKSNGIYSIYNGWLKHPVQEDIPELDTKAFDKLFNDWESQYFDIIENVTDVDKIDDFIEDLYDLRKNSIAKDGEYGLGNLVFKEFRNLGYLDNLKELKRKEIEKDLSLESINC